MVINGNYVWQGLFMENPHIYIDISLTFTQMLHKNFPRFPDF